RSFINRFAEGVAKQEIRPFSRVPQVRLKRVVIGVCNRLLCSDGSEIGTQRAARAIDDFARFPGEDAVLSEWPTSWTVDRQLAGIAQAQAKRRVPGVCLLHDHQMMALVSGVAQRQQST